MRIKEVSYGNTVVRYDADCPCEICSLPVENASVGGVDICPACDMGKCRFCKKRSVILRVKLDGGRSLRRWRDHVRSHLTQ